MSPLGESSSLTSERVSAASDIIDDEFLVVHRASQVLYQHPGGTHAHALAITFLPAFVRNFLDVYVVTNTYNLVDKPSMQALAMGGKLAFVMSYSSFRGKIPLAILPGEASLAMLLDAPLFIVVLRVVG